MEITYPRHPSQLVKSLETYPELSVMDDFFAGNHYQIHQFSRADKGLPLVLPEDYSTEQGTVVAQANEQVFLWESLTTQKSISVSGDSSGEEISESGIVEESKTYKEAEVQTSAQWAPQANQHSEHFFLFICTHCRLRCMDNRLRRCLPCGYWLCGQCEDLHPITHSILYYRTEEQLRKDHC